MQADVKTGNTKLIVAFRNFMIAPKNSVLLSITLITLLYVTQSKLHIGEVQAAPFAAPPHPHPK